MKTTSYKGGATGGATELHAWLADSVTRSSKAVKRRKLRRVHMPPKL